MQKDELGKVDVFPSPPGAQGDEAWTWFLFMYSIKEKKMLFINLININFPSLLKYAQKVILTS